MMIIGIIFLLIGILGFFWTIFGSMIISIIFNLFNFNKKSSLSLNTKEVSFEILLAAYNEEKTIAETLKSFQKSYEVIKSEKIKINLSAFVGLDHCTDKTLSVVLDLQKNSSLPIKYFENDGQRGKWFVIKQLILKSDADWVSLTDCGSIWNERLIYSVSKFLYDEDIICIAPSYLPVGAGLLESLYWRMEQVTRHFENLSGGSIMVHGLTVFYKRSALLRALELLGDKHWFNDDVALPLTLRFDNPKNKILYFASIKPIAWVRDIGVVSNIGTEKNRRKRILIGNLQIIKDLIIPNFKINKMASLTSLRLVFKALWAYWATFFGLGSMFIICSSELFISKLVNQSLTAIVIEIFALMILMSIVVKSNYVQRLFMAYLSGLQIRKSWKALDNPKNISWS